MLISEEVQLRKPQPEIFWKAADALNVQACESVFVGDSPKADVIGAKNAGMREFGRVAPTTRSQRQQMLLLMS